MFALSDSARTELDAFFDGKDKSPIRVYLAPGGCSGPRLALALDETRPEDKTFDDNGYTFCVNSELMESAGEIRIDFSPMGFSIESGLKFESAGGGCSGCSGCGTDA